jgi:hypothetical protein
MSAHALPLSFIPHPEATYYVRHGSLILVIDRAAITDDGDIVITRLHNQMMVTRLEMKDAGVRVEFEVWGKVLYLIQSL